MNALIMLSLAAALSFSAFFGGLFGSNLNAETDVNASADVGAVPRSRLRMKVRPRPSPQVPLLA